jgi:hypothetical protein
LSHAFAQALHEAFQEVCARDRARDVADGCAVGGDAGGDNFERIGLRRVRQVAGILAIKRTHADVVARERVRNASAQHGPTPVRVERLSPVAHGQESSQLRRRARPISRTPRRLGAHALRIFAAIAFDQLRRPFEPPEPD